jgi:hypothetical protein
MFIYWAKANVNFLLKSYNIDGAVNILHYFIFLTSQSFNMKHLTEQKTYILISFFQFVISEYIMV